MTDAKALVPSWQPHFYYQPHFVAGLARQAFDLHMTPGANFFTEWRDESVYPGCIGPSVAFDASGRISAAGKTLLTVPIDGWTHVEIETRLGKNQPRTFRLTVVPPGGERQVFADLPFTGAEFHELHWLGFSSTAAANTAFYLDNLTISLGK